MTAEAFDADAAMPARRAPADRAARAARRRALLRELSEAQALRERVAPRRARMARARAAHYMRTYRY